MGTHDNDMLLALRFFHGKLILHRRADYEYERATDGVGGIEYVLTDAEERESREAIVRLLSLPTPPTQLVETISAAFAPTGPDAGPRRADLKFRSPSRPTDEIRIAHILTLVACYLDKMSVELAQAEVARDTGETEGAVRGIWDRNKILRERIRKHLRR